MQDRPTATELLEAIEGFLRDRSGASEDRWMRFQLLVAANSLGIVRRELAQEETYERTEWLMLDGLLGEAPMPATFGELTVALRARTGDLSDRIRAGGFDEPERESALREYLVAECMNRVRISAPAELDA
jgi:hypothetical protein